ncbi:hypothetical protein KQX54_015806 [Cotesia glomerata]|uniref:Uncharacterized protein n=1 Tax=Cotesia glomerata TaxID=32391 RepID=A0AAV7IX05_COTGL|nr:hypothetical protein KQX54_015806 [Cotesia glomerata]
MERLVTCAEDVDCGEAGFVGASKMDGHVVTLTTFSAILSGLAICGAVRNTKVEAQIAFFNYLVYSGTGRKVHNIGKENFSATHTYNCLKEVVEEKFGDSDQSKSLRVKLGSFLANAGDRDGGRRQRAINSDNNIQNNNNNNNKNNNNSQ